MPTPRKGPAFGGSPAHQRLMLANMASHLFESGAITTTLAKAKALRPYAERLITKAKKGGVHQQRQVVATIHDPDVVQLLFELGGEVEVHDVREVLGELFRDHLSKFR